MAKQRIWKIWRKDAYNIEYQVLSRFNAENNDEEDCNVLYDYFQVLIFIDFFIQLIFYYF